jgi:hypothetical protein
MVPGSQAVRQALKHLHQIHATGLPLNTAQRFNAFFALFRTPMFYRYILINNTGQVIFFFALSGCSFRLLSWIL